jgi:hypothetical protein
MYLYGVGYRFRSRKRDRAISFIALMTSIVVAQKLSSLDPFKCKWVYLEMLYWLPTMTLEISSKIIAHQITVTRSLSWASRKCQRSVNEVSMILIWWFRESQDCIETSIQRYVIRRHWTQNGMRYADCAILEINVNGASPMSGCTSWIITGLCSRVKP